MKQFFIAACLATSLVANADVIFSEEFNSPEDFAKWTVADANNDEKTWIFSEDASPSKVYYSYHSTNNADDWLFSPEITIPKTSAYLVSYDFSGSSYGEAMDVWTGTAPSADAMTNKMGEYPTILDGAQGQYFIANFEEGEKVTLGFHAVSGADKFRLYLINVKMSSTDNPVDLCVTDILSPITGENLGSEEVTIKIANKGLVDVDSFDVFFTVGEGEAVTETVNSHLAVGEEMEYTFTAKADLSQPRGIYTITAGTSHTDDFMPSNDTASAVVRHVAPASIPYYMGFEDEEDTSGLTYLNLNEDSGAWHVAYNDFFFHLSRSGYAALGYNYDSSNAADDWAFLEPIEMEAGYYVLKFWYSATDGHPERMRVCYGSAPIPEAMTNLLCEYDPMTNGNYLESINIFELAEDSKIYFGFYAFSGADENWILIDDISITKVDNTSLDLNVTEMKAPFDFMRASNKKDVTFNVFSVGIIDTDAKARLLIDGVEAASVDFSISAQESKDITFADALEGLTAGKHEVNVVVDCEKDSDMSNNSLAKEVTFVENPVYLWDFEDGQIPSQLTYRSEDYGTVNPNAGEEFDENGWGIFKLEHFMLGSHALALSSWLDNEDRADRWLVMPQVKVNNEEAYFVWDANSFTLPEDYDVKVSDGTDAWYDYTTLMEVKQETTSPKTRGISLAEFVGKDVLVAINLRTYTDQGEALILDNIGFYGNVAEGSTVGMKSVSAEGCKIYVADELVTVDSTDCASIEVYALDGSLVASKNGNSLDISSLAHGGYIIRANTGNGVITSKIMK